MNLSGTDFVESGKILVRVWQKDYDLIDETILNAGEFTRLSRSIPPV